MSDRVGNREDRFSHNEAQIIITLQVQLQPLLSYALQRYMKAPYQPTVAVRFTNIVNTSVTLAAARLWYTYTVMQITGGTGAILHAIVVGVVIY